LAEFDKQIPVERRTKPTPSFGWYSFFGRRKQDHYSAPLFFSLVSITGLNVLDSLFTMMILDRKGWEANPIVRAVMETHGDNFWIWKFALVSFCLILLCLHSRYKVVKRMMVFLTSVYLVTVVYQIYLLHLP
jgi:putative copper export protein